MDLGDTALGDELDRVGYSEVGLELCKVSFWAPCLPRNWIQKYYIDHAWAFSLIVF